MVGTSCAAVQGRHGWDQLCSNARKAWLGPAVQQCKEGMVGTSCVAVQGRHGWDQLCSSDTLLLLLQKNNSDQPNEDTPVHTYIRTHSNKEPTALSFRTTLKFIKFRITNTKFFLHQSCIFLKFDQNIFPKTMCNGHKLGYATRVNGRAPGHGHPHSQGAGG